MTKHAGTKGRQRFRVAGIDEQLVRSESKARFRE